MQLPISSSSRDPFPSADMSSKHMCEAGTFYTEQTEQGGL